jgi:hypothetical protein
MSDRLLLLMQAATGAPVEIPVTPEADADAVEEE